LSSNRSIISLRNTNRSRKHFGAERRCVKLKPQKKEDADTMLTLADFSSVFDDELEDEFRAREEEEEK
ncbi:unnamed protein product, partial [Cochlearia groenlandica]